MAGRTQKGPSGRVRTGPRVSRGDGVGGEPSEGAGQWPGFNGRAGGQHGASNTSPAGSTPGRPARYTTTQKPSCGQHTIEASEYSAKPGSDSQPGGLCTPSPRSASLTGPSPSSSRVQMTLTTTELRMTGVKNTPRSAL